MLDLTPPLVLIVSPNRVVIDSGRRWRRKEGRYFGSLYVATLAVASRLWGRLLPPRRDALVASDA